MSNYLNNEHIGSIILIDYSKMLSKMFMFFKEYIFFYHLVFSDFVYVEKGSSEAMD